MTVSHITLAAIGALTIIALLGLAWLAYVNTETARTSTSSTSKLIATSLSHLFSLTLCLLFLSEQQTRCIQTHGVSQSDLDRGDVEVSVLLQRLHQSERLKELSHLVEVLATAQSFHTSRYGGLYGLLRHVRDLLSRLKLVQKDADNRQL